MKTNLMSATGSLGEEPQIPGEGNVCLREHITCRVLRTNLDVPVSPRATNWLRGTAEPPREFQQNCQENRCAIPSTIILFHTFFQNTAFGVYSLTSLLKSEESMRALEVFREQHIHLYQIMQFNGSSTLNSHRINNIFQQRLGLPWYLLNSDRLMQFLICVKPWHKPKVGKKLV